MRITLIGAFDKYFLNLTEYCLTMYGGKPMVPFSVELDREMITSEPDEEDEVAWQPKRILNGPDWCQIEEALGFRLVEELKGYYSTYLFFSLNGEFDNAQLYFEPLIAEEKIHETIAAHHQDAQYVFPDSQMFMIGNAVIQGDDTYALYFDNTRSEIFCFEPEGKNYIFLAFSFAELVSKLEAFD